MGGQVISNSANITIQANCGGIVPVMSAASTPIQLQIPYTVSGLTVAGAPSLVTHGVVELDVNGSTIPSTASITMDGVTDSGTAFNFVLAVTGLQSTTVAIFYTVQLNLGLDYPEVTGVSPALSLTLGGVMNNPSTQAYSFPVTSIPAAAITSMQLSSISSITTYPSFTPTATVTGSTPFPNPQPLRGTTVTVPTVTIPVTVPPGLTTPIPPSQVYLGLLFTVQLGFASSYR